MFKFTPGPWRISTQDISDTDIPVIVPTEIIGSDGSFVVADLGGLAPEGYSLDLVQGNAWLISAAPEMYQALEELEKVYDASMECSQCDLAELRGKGKCSDHRQEIAEAWEFAEMVMARVKGGGK